MRSRFFLTLLLTSLALATAADEAPRPNIIYIMVDDLGYGDLGSYGQKVIQTPHLDQMAAEGMRFTDHYAGHTVCRPSRLVLWTGQHVGTTGINGNLPYSFTGKEATVGKLLQQAGYQTAGIGKWACGHVTDPAEIDNPGHPNHNGFDYWMGYMNQSNAHNFYPTYLWENMTQVPLKGNVIGDYPEGKGLVSSERVTYSHDVMTERMLSWIEKHHADPFLFHIHWTIPHTNNEGGRVTGDGQEVPDYGSYADRDWPNPEKGFAAMIERMDKDVGRLFALLKKLGIDENTLVCFTSDNGPHEEGGHLHEFFDSNGVLTGYKRSMHEGGIRVPMIARWPGQIEAGSKTGLPSAFWDFLPTACELAGIDAPEEIDGISYVPTLLGQDDQQKKHDYLYWGSREGDTSIGIRHGKWKLVKYREIKPGTKRRGKLLDPVGPDEWRLYDLSQDLPEANNLIDQHPEIAEKMRAMVAADGLPLSAQRR